MVTISNISIREDINAWDGSTIESDPSHAVARVDGLQGGKLYAFKGEMTGAEYVRIAFYDVGGSRLTFAANTSTALPFYFNSPAGCTFAFVVVMTDGNNTTSTMSIEEVEQVTTGNPVLTLGDSTALYGYQQVLTNAGIYVVIKGFPGSTVATGFKNPITNQYPPSIMTEGCNLNPNDYSGLILLAGFNDSGFGKLQNGYETTGVEWGDLNSGDNTYVGAMRKLLQHFASIPRFVITPYKRTDDNWFFWQFNQKTRGVLFVEGVPHFDMYSYGIWDKDTAVNYLGDNVHPNPLGANILGQYALAGYNQFIKK